MSAAAAAALTLAFAGANIAIEIEDARDVSDKQLRAIVGELENAIARATGDDPSVQPYAPGRECQRDDRCVGQIKSWTGAGEIVFVRVFAVPSRVRVFAERVGGEGRALGRASADLSRDSERWVGSLDSLAAQLFPKAGSHGLSRAGGSGSSGSSAGSDLVAIRDPNLAPGAGAGSVTAAGEDEGGLSKGPVPWIVLGGSVVAGGIGVALGVANANAREEGSRPGLPPARVEELRDETFRTGLGANILFATAVTGLVTGVIMLAAD